MNITATATLIISGASGAVGSWLVQTAALLPRQIKIIPIYRSGSSRDSALAASPSFVVDRLTPVIADITIPESLSRARASIGSRHVAIGIHAAADVAWDKSLEDVRKVNIEGSMNFGRFIASVSPDPRLIYISTAYTNTTGWKYRNGYEESKAMAENWLRMEFAGILSVFSCSLVVGCSQNGILTRHNGLYPLIKFIALSAPPFLVGRVDGLLDVVPVDWVVEELLALIAGQLVGESPRDVVAAAGDQRIRFDEALRIIESRINMFRKDAGLDPIGPIPILRNRQWEFLSRSLRIWRPEDLSLREFRHFERLLSVYKEYTESDTVRPPFGVTRPTPSPYKVLPIITDRWLVEHKRVIQKKWLRRGAIGTKGYLNA